MTTMTTTKQKMLLMYMPNGGQDGQMNVWYQGDRSHVEFRGRPYTEWDSEFTDDWFQRSHDVLEGWHSCVLHTDQTLAILPTHPDYADLVALMAEAQAVS